ASSKRKARRSAKVKSKAKVSKKTVATSKSRRSKKSASRSAKAVRAGAIKKTSKSRSRRARNAKRYRVRKGDTLYGISKSTGVSMKRLKRLNKLGNNKISVGRKLRLVRR
ncbi:MAG: LysM peptidoglycan-binding domain-containing protein, partial [Thiotrichaceae bacterium]|nr:LysM peptidoglycan-binding domain-containing protein [Thiotrichaceae bacterium]